VNGTKGSRRGKERKRRTEEEGRNFVQLFFFLRRNAGNLDQETMGPASATVA